MNLNEYKAWQPKFQPAWTKGPINSESIREWSILEMCGEAGEVLELLQKACRKDRMIDTDKLKDELSDVLWGFTAILNANGWTYEEVAEYNYNKLEERNKG
jgi:NTP pyrophosphatase (non-canonical NTP hydrolase)